MTYATVSDVAAELGRPIPSDVNVINQWNRWLSRVENIIVARIPDLAGRIAEGTLSAALVADVEAAAVARKAQNPEGLRQTTKSIDDGSVTKIVDQSRSVGEIDLLPEEWALLLPRADSGAFSTRPGFEPDRVPWHDEVWS